ncbi:protein-L-isoaspartate O-methyltransferase family protein [Devosia sp. SL43]|uniref:protein-L-isoaspartate O-methyltransferase family protein n=1 Tax=Devosia sp. SL43 TaxID=2806348 RepID=UPI001F33E767|nr:methyltransferase domain-containing protein [Devosia sp. SL43]UJW85949.1 methyltransferase domain-containing protein [Devosia sp. SL43]
MTDFERVRAYMVDNQLRTSGVTEHRLLASMAAVPRELFVSADRQAVAYVDDVQWLGQPPARRFMPPPALLAKLLQLAEITEKDHVLDIGAATGYATAVIAGYAASATGLEADAGLVGLARANLERLGLANADIVAGDIAALRGRQFDVVIVQGALDNVPDTFFAALKDGGRLVALVRQGRVAVANVFVKAGTTITARGEFNATLPPLLAPQAVEDFVF